MLNMRNYRGTKRRGVAVSTDGGMTWSEPVDDPTLVEPVCQASFIRYSTADATGGAAGGKTLLLFSNPASPTGRHHLTVRASYDEGQTWPAARLLYEGSSAYSCLAKLPDGRIGILYERDNYKKITFAAFDLNWVEQGSGAGDQES